MALELKYSPEKHFPAIVTGVSHLTNIVKNIKARLTPTQLEMVRGTFISRFIDIDFTFSGPLLHLVLFRELKEEDDEDEDEESNQHEMGFLIRGQARTFTKDDFAHFSGLPRGRNLFRNDHSIRLRELLFKDCYNVNKDDLDDKYLDNDLVEDADIVKFKLVYIVKLVLLGGLRKKHIDNGFFSLVEEEEMWNSFDWVDIVYSLTIGSLQGAIDGGLESYEKKIKGMDEETTKKLKKTNPDSKMLATTYTLSRFPYVFQAWIYEQRDVENKKREPPLIIGFLN